MGKDLDMVYRTDRKIVYKVPSIKNVTGEFLRALDWPSGVTGLIFVFKEQIAAEHEILSALPLDLDVGLVYSATKESLPAGAAPSADGFSQDLAPGEDELSKLYLLGREMVLAPVLSVRNIPPVDPAAVKNKVRKQLAEGKVGLWSRRGAPAGAIALTWWHDFADNPVQWIPWVWIAGDLLPDERRNLHGRISAWLKSGVEGKVQCVVDSYNIRSQKFFRKMGFIPECLHIVKS